MEKNCKEFGLLTGLDKNGISFLTVSQYFLIALTIISHSSA